MAYYEQNVTKNDLIDFAKGVYFKEGIINTYMRILEKMNQVMLASNDYQMEVVASRETYWNATTSGGPQKIFYYNTNFIQQLNDPDMKTDCVTTLQNYFRYDTVMLPFFINE